MDSFLKILKIFCRGIVMEDLSCIGRPASDVPYAPEGTATSVRIS